MDDRERDKHEESEQAQLCVSKGSKVRQRF